MKFPAHPGLMQSALVVVVVSFAGSQLAACNGSRASGNGGSGGQITSGGRTGSGGATSQGGATSSGGTTGSGGQVATGGAGGAGTGGAAAGGGTTTQGGTRGGSSGAGGTTATGGATEARDAPVSDKYVVAMVQSTKANASDLTDTDVADLVEAAVTQAGGLDFIRTGQTVVLKPNLLTAYEDGGRQQADQTVNGISTDWRVLKAVADLVREKVGESGKILVMEGSVMSTLTAYSILGYTKENIAAVDEFIALEGTSCTDNSTNGLVQRTAPSGKQYWINQRYVEADVVISLPVMKTHLQAGITGGVKNLGIGVTPVGQYRAAPLDAGRAPGANDCTRGQTAATIDHSSPELLGAFIRDYYSLRPADFVVMDALQGLEHGPLPVWDPPPGDGGGRYSYDDSKKNMRLILAGRNAVAVDTIEALVMKCDPKKVPHLTMLEADGLGTTDTSRITLVGQQVSEVAKPFAGKLVDICPGT